MHQQARLRIEGRVQGVFYRKSAEEKANSLGLSGWVRNLEDGSVEAFASGSKDLVEQFIAWCHEGPRGARVDKVNVVWKDGALLDDEKVEAGTRFKVTGRF